MPDEENEKRLTRAEWEREQQVAECADTHHAPSIRLATLADPIGSWVCDCGLYCWTAQRRDT